MMKKLIPVLCLAIAATSPIASALTPSEVKWCKATAASFGDRQAAIQKDNAERTALAEKAELAGEAWENAEALRNFGDAEAAEADKTKLAYDEAKAAFYEVDTRVTENTIKLNADFEKFNSVCVSG